MPTLIDGHNLLHAVRKESPERPPSRAILCHYLGHWARRTRERVSIVFDGPAPTPELMAQIEHADLEIEFSGAGTTADSVIIDKINADSAARRLTIVSSDREIRRAARRRRAKTAKSEEYWEQIQTDLARPAPTRREPHGKHIGLNSGDTEYWLRELGFDEEGNPPQDGR